MANLTSALQQLREERKQAQYQVEKLDSAISVLEDLVGRNGSLTRTAAGGSRVVTAAARRRMAAATRLPPAAVRVSEPFLPTKSSSTEIAESNFSTWYCACLRSSRSSWSALVRLAIVFLS